MWSTSRAYARATASTHHVNTLPPLPRNPLLLLHRILLHTRWQGCWQFAGGHGREVFTDLEAKLAAHAEAGLTTFDTADIYGPSEEILGQFAAAWAASGRPPLQLFTKYVPNIFQKRPTPADVAASVNRSLTKLKVQQLDCVQLHW